MNHEQDVVGYVPGGFDMFHIGHLNILQASRQYCDRLIVGVATDEALVEMKGRLPVVPHRERMAIVASVGIVDDVVTDVSRDKRIAWQHHPFDVLFKGDDWKGTAKGERLEAEMAEVGVRVVYLPYTPSTSSTMLRQFITNYAPDPSTTYLPDASKAS
jgi:glycerol-3-phosphate cytidylyltransferase